MKEKIINIFVALNYVVLMLVIMGQCAVGSNFMVGQLLFLGGNVLSVARCFVLKRPMADKVRDCACTAITLGLIAIKILGGIHS